MRASLCSWALICLLVLGIPMMGGAQKVGEKGPKKTNLVTAALAALRLEGEEQIEQLRALSQEYADLEAALVQEFRHVTRVEQKFAVAYLMGRFPSTVFVPDLAANVTLRFKSNKLDGKSHLWGDYPAAGALIKIGKPAVKAMVRNIETGKDKEFRKLSTDVLAQIEGAEVGRFILESELKKTKDETGRQRFQEALDYMAKTYR